MLPFRSKTPKHRPKRKKCKNYSSYLKTLKEDYNYRCGYCDDPDELANRSFVIDHFVPQKPDGCTSHIPPNRYRNLVYSCSFCNGAKSNKWPSKDSKIANNGVSGFVMPTEPIYAKQFFRDNSGNIRVHPGSSVAQYIYDELNLWWPVHGLYWQFETIKNQEIKLEQLLQNVKNRKLKEKWKALRLQRVAVVDEILKQVNRK